jgi:tetratricopeptide (TPR) repeat protein
MDRNWYRNTSWDEEIEKYFFTKLNRVRDKGMQAQYLIAQAGALASTKDTEWMKVAEVLINKQLTEYSDIFLDKSSALGLLGNIYGFRGDYNKSLEYYKQAIDFEAIYPNCITNSFMDYAELVVKINRTDLFEDVEKIFSEERYESVIVFPLTKYMKYSILSIISKYKGDTEKAKYYADLVEQNVVAVESGFRNHKTLGLVRQRDPLLDKLMYE